MLKESGISIKSAMEMQCMEKCKIIAGHGGINKIITKLNVMADPDILNWVSEGELLLTTAYSFLFQNSSTIIKNTAKIRKGMPVNGLDDGAVTREGNPGNPESAELNIMATNRLFTI
ncbi:MAG: PucR family transcriptional regulator ligand-binding domain-containing protein [Euryarchaeota archaeon]|nr:PucR family transcriptional regulator ligand-binding domain-containing protein [Euryarchaeota archaeon]